MPKLYNRCAICHETIKPLQPYCFGCGSVRLYTCQHDYWWELLYLTIRTMFRDIKVIWRRYLEYNKQMEKLRKDIEK